MGDSPSPRPPPAAGGLLSRTPLVHVLLYALDKRLAGTMEFRAFDGRLASILFVAGRPAKVRTTEPAAFLGQCLRELGFLSEAQLHHSLDDLMAAKAVGPALHGQLLLKAGLLDEHQLEAGLREQLERKLGMIATLPSETRYEYFNRYDALHDWGPAEAPGTDPVAIVWRLLCPQSSEQPRRSGARDDGCVADSSFSRRTAKPPVAPPRPPRRGRVAPRAPDARRRARLGEWPHPA